MVGKAASKQYSLWSINCTFKVLPMTGLANIKLTEHIAYFVFS
jgi:hypothetical protein